MPISDMRKDASQILFLHGWATDSQVWKYQVQEFSKDYEIAVIDISESVDEYKWIELLSEQIVNKFSDKDSRVTKLIGIGWSLGASILIQMAHLRPALFKGLILTGATPKFVSDNTFPWGQSKGIAKRMTIDIRNDFSDTLKRFYPLNFTEEELASNEAKEFIKYYNKKVTELSNERTISALKALLTLDLRHIVSEIDIPVFLIHGDKDNVCPVGAANYLAQKFPDARLEIFKDTGHAPFLTRTKEFNSLVKKFMDRVVN